MAESGANNEVRIKVILDSAEAQARLAEIKAEMDALNSQMGGGGGGGSANGIGAEASYGSNPAPTATTNARGGVGSSPIGGNEGKVFGAAAATAIVAGIKKSMDFIFSEAGKNFYTDYLRKRSPYIDNFENEKEYARRQTSISTAQQYGGLGMAAGATTGALIGSIVPGIGTVIGGAIGGLFGLATGGGIGWQMGGARSDEQMDLKRKYERENEKFAKYFMAQNANESVDKGIGNAAFRKSIQYAGSLDKRIGQYEDAIEQLVNGSGESSISNLRSRRDKLIRENKISSPEYQEVDRRLKEQMGTWSELQQGLFEQKYLQNQPKPYDGSDFSDSFSQKGLYVGGQVDVGKANQPIIDNLAQIRQTILQQTDRMLDKMGVNEDTAHTPDSAHFLLGTSRGSIYQ